MVQRGLSAACMLAFALLAACAAEVPAVPTSLVPLSSTGPDLVIDSDVPVRLTTGYLRIVRASTRWRLVGALPEGVVYRPIGTVFSVEGRQVHEAYLVIRGESLQGFFLAAEGRYSALPTPIPLPIEKGAKP
jgi:hypothetical protein